MVYGDFNWRPQMSLRALCIISCTSGHLTDYWHLLWRVGPIIWVTCFYYVDRNSGAHITGLAQITDINQGLAVGLYLLLCPHIKGAIKICPCPSVFQSVCSKIIKKCDKDGKVETFVSYRHIFYLVLIFRCTNVKVKKLSLFG